jgi:hypothetical protein
MVFIVTQAEISNQRGGIVGEGTTIRRKTVAGQPISQR